MNSFLVVGVVAPIAGSLIVIVQLNRLDTWSHNLTNMIHGHRTSPNVDTQPPKLAKSGLLSLLLFASGITALSHIGVL